MITLLTDFGLQDIYVGVIKGVIKTINPSVDLIDLTHEIPRQNILAGRFALLQAVDFFPPNTIHLAIVDPQVGSLRKAIAIAFEKGYLIAPNNGILSGVFEKYKPKKIIELTNNNYWLKKNPSSTFHGRDIFAPVAAHLSKKISLKELGNKINYHDLITVNIPSIIIKENEIIGSIQYIDIYGNLITNIPNNLLKNKSWYIIENKLKIEHKITYSSVNQGDLVALMGSHGWLEIAVNGGNAKIRLNKKYFDPIQVKFQ